MAKKAIVKLRREKNSLFFEVDCSEKRLAGVELSKVIPGAIQYLHQLSVQPLSNSSTKSLRVFFGDLPRFCLLNLYLASVSSSSLINKVRVVLLESLLLPLGRPIFLARTEGEGICSSGARLFVGMTFSVFYFLRYASKSDISPVDESLLLFIKNLLYN